MAEKSMIENDPLKNKNFKAPGVIGGANAVPLTAYRLKSLPFAADAVFIAPIPP